MLSSPLPFACAAVGTTHRAKRFVPNVRNEGQSPYPFAQSDWARGWACTPPKWRILNENSLQVSMIYYSTKKKKKRKHVYIYRLIYQTRFLEFAEESMIPVWLRVRTCVGHFFNL